GYSCDTPAECSRSGSSRLVIAGAVTCLDGLWVLRVPSSLLVATLRAHLGPVLFVPLPLQFSMTLCVLGMPFAPSSRRLAGLALLPFFLGLHSRASIRKKTS